MNKPKLIDKKLLNKIKINYNKINLQNEPNNYLNNSLNKISFFISKYSDFIIVLLILSLILFLRYRFNKNIKNMKKKPNEININYFRNKNIFDNNYTIEDKIETNDTIDGNIIEKIKNQINNFDENN